MNSVLTMRTPFCEKENRFCANIYSMDPCVCASKNIHVDVFRHFRKCSYGLDMDATFRRYHVFLAQSKKCDIMNGMIFGVKKKALHQKNAKTMKSIKRRSEPK